MSYTWTDGETITAEKLNETGKILKVELVTIANISFNISDTNMTSTGSGGTFSQNKTFKELIGNNIIIGFRLINAGAPNTQNIENWFLYPDDITAGGVPIFSGQSFETIQDKNNWYTDLHCKYKTATVGSYAGLIQAICIKQ